MKTTTLLIAFLCLSVSLQAQFLREGSSFGITFSGLGHYDRFTFSQRMGVSGFTGLGHYSFGITYIQPLSNQFDWEIGIEYSRAKIIHFFMSPENATRFHLSLIRVPVTFRFNFWQYFFFNGGFFLGINMNQSRGVEIEVGGGEVVETGKGGGDAGIILGVGARYDFRNIPVGLFINPYLNNRAVYGMLETGFRMGVMYNF